MSSAWQPHSLGLLRRLNGGSYIPGPAPDAAGNEDDDVKMSFVSVLKTLVIPALISLILYLIISYALVPIWKRYRGRYSTYLPLDTISTQTTTWRQRIGGALIRRLLPSTWRTDFGQGGFAVNGQDGSDFDEEEGEELYEVDQNRREALSLDARRGTNEDGSRLSRDLEEGFKDDSEDEEEDALPGRQGRTLSR
ncbi:hypothetical protein L207DRAFT_542478 [Hyaloscypha variabilis F]|uniref:Uncharacterized protein n=1 Tax=Hyaloscypha variabilis (strain UAMH 11265 / GT02V1 / F) TaxID=1149755 RepID=A0A2J6RX35_HYAVF|nr:hypothetical protein L207DRAFT_542478 [Hyaloscypha variabilis F]